MRINDPVLPNTVPAVSEVGAVAAAVPAAGLGTPSIAKAASSSFVDAGSANPPVAGVLDAGLSGARVDSPAKDVIAASGAPANSMALKDLSQDANGVAMMLASQLLSAQAMTKGPDGTYAMTPGLVQEFLDAAPPAASLDKDQAALLAQVTALKTEMAGRTLSLSDADFAS